MVIDDATDVRDGEALDSAAVDAFMKQAVPGLSGLPAIRQYPGGASNLTYRLDYADRSFVLRRPPLGPVAKSAHDMLREARVMAALRPVYPFVPEVVAVCDDRRVLGCDFYVMQRLDGVILRQEMPSSLALSAADRTRLCRSVIDKLVELHRVDVDAAGLAHLGKGDGYVRRQIEGWSERFRRARTDDVGPFTEVMRWLHDHMPDDCDQVLIHNDYRFDNVVLDADNPFSVTGVLDWEMATIGDPLMDLGNSLAYWIQADDDPGFQRLRRQPTHLPGMMTRQEVVDYYLSQSGRSVVAFDFYEIYGLFRLAVIIQQIYHRYYHGQTRDERFAAFGKAANYLEQRCLRRIGESELSWL